MDKTCRYLESLTMDRYCENNVVQNGLGRFGDFCIVHQPRQPKEKQMSGYQVGDTIDHMTNVSGFHSRDGLFFKRVNNGDVRVQKWSNTAPFTLLSSVIVDAHIWASIVASVSFDGEDGKSYREALGFHERRGK